jgi:hypothetical protein
MSTKQAITADLLPLNTKWTTTYEVGNPVPGLGQAPTYDGVKPVKVIPTFLS